MGMMRVVLLLLLVVVEGSRRPPLLTGVLAQQWGRLIGCIFLRINQMPLEQSSYEVGGGQ